MSVIPNDITHITFIKESNTDDENGRSSRIVGYIKNAINISDKKPSQTAIIFDIDAEGINRTIQPLTLYIIFNVLKYTKIVFSNSDQCYEIETPRINIFPLTSMFETGFLEIFELCSDSLLQLLKTIPGSSTSMSPIFSALIRTTFYNLCGDLQSSCSPNEALEHYACTPDLSDNANEDEWLRDNETISIFKNLLDDWFCADSELFQLVSKAFELKTKSKQSIVNINFDNIYTCSSKLMAIMFREYERLGLDTVKQSEVIFLKSNNLIYVNVMKNDCCMKSCKIEIFNIMSQISGVNFIHPAKKVHCKSKQTECVYTNFVDLCDRKSQTLTICIPCRFLQ